MKQTLYVCSDCETEFSIKTDSIASIEYCPFCGSEFDSSDETFKDTIEDEDWEEN
jgi:DNA-directed RNA polymerase subunit RPC12/RpoP